MDNKIYLEGYFISFTFCLKVACALLMSGEDLDKHVEVKNVLVEMGTYFQVQVLFDHHLHLFILNWHALDN